MPNVIKADEKPYVPVETEKHINKICRCYVAINTVEKNKAEKETEKGIKGVRKEKFQF